MSRLILLKRIKLQWKLSRSCRHSLRNQDGSAKTVSKRVSTLQVLVLTITLEKRR